LAVVFACKHFQQYLYGHKDIVFWNGSSILKTHKAR
jgi:hypothetical protein